jgi:Tol biopolymer transport system component
VLRFRGLTLFLLLVAACIAASEAAASIAKTERVSVSSIGVEGNQMSYSAFISAGGRFVVFDSNADNLVGEDSNTYRDVFIRDRKLDKTRLVNVSSAGEQANNDFSEIYSNGSPISADGRFVVFSAFAANLVPSDLNSNTDVFIRDRQNHTTRRISVNSAEEEAQNGDSVDPAISPDGRFVVFASLADNLVPNDSNGSVDVFIRDRKKGVTKRVSVNSSEQESHAGGSEASVSANGRYVLFGSTSDNLAPGPVDGHEDAYVRDRWKGTTRRVSVNTRGHQANESVGYMSISNSGRFVVFETNANNLVKHDTNGQDDVFVRDRRAKTTRRVSVSSSEKQVMNWSGYAHISPGGRFVAFESPAGHLVPGDDNGIVDIFVRDLRNGTTMRVTSRSGGSSPYGSEYPTITADGRFVAFQSDVNNLVPGDTNGVADAFVRGPLR